MSTSKKGESNTKNAKEVEVRYPKRHGVQGSGVFYAQGEDGAYSVVTENQSGRLEVKVRVANEGSAADAVLQTMRDQFAGVQDGISKYFPAEESMPTASFNAEKNTLSVLPAGITHDDVSAGRGDYIAKLLPNGKVRHYIEKNGTIVRQNTLLSSETGEQIIAEVNRTAEWLMAQKGALSQLGELEGSGSLPAYSVDTEGSAPKASAEKKSTKKAEVSA